MPHHHLEELRIPVAGLELAALASGPSDGVPVLAMHGWLDNGATFTPLRRLLPETLRIVAIDLPGHGRSQHRPAGQAYHFVDWIPTAVGVADALGWDRFRILGHSMGAAIGCLVAGACPDRVEALALIDGLGPWTAPDDEAPAQLARALAEHKTLASKRPRKMSDVDRAITVLATAYADLSPPSLRVLLERGLVHTEDGVHFSYDLKLRAASFLRFTEPQILAILAAIKARVLFVRPDNGWPVDPAGLDRRGKAIADFERLDIPGGHHVHLEHPNRLATAIGAFLGR